MCGYYTYYRYNERTGMRVQIRIEDETAFWAHIGSWKSVNTGNKFFTKRGEPRKSIVVKGKRYYKE